MGYARIHISEQLFLEAMHFPVGTIVKQVASVYENGCTDVEVILSHPDIMDAVPVEGKPLPLITPLFRETYTSIDLVDWGQK